MKVYRTWTTRLLAWLAISMIALTTFTACKDDGADSLTLEEYFQQVDALDNSNQERIDAVFNGITDEGDIQQFRDAFKDFAPILEEVADEFDDIDAPEAAEAKHDAAAEALNNFAAAATDAADGIDSLDASTPDELFAAVDEQGFSAASEAFTAACMDLQNLAADNGIVVDLNCEDDEDEATAAAEQAIRDVAAAWNAKDIDAFGALFTDHGLIAAFAEGEDAPRDEVLASVGEDIGVGALEIREISTEPSDTGADVTVLWVSGEVLEKFRFSLIEEAGAWKIDGQEDLAVEVPEGAAVVQVDMTEFAFAFDPADIPDGEFYFQFTNAGQQQHHAFIARIPADLDIQAALLSEEDPEGQTDIGGIAPQDPGATATFAIANGLEPGRYVMLCFLPDTTDPEETPHALKGMVAEFTIP